MNKAVFGVWGLGSRKPERRTQNAGEEQKQFTAFVIARSHAVGVIEGDAAIPL